MSDWFARYEQELLAAAQRAQAPAPARLRVPRRLAPAVAFACAIALVAVVVPRLGDGPAEQPARPALPGPLTGPLQGRWEGEGGALLTLRPDRYRAQPAAGATFAGRAQLLGRELLLGPGSRCGATGRYTVRVDGDRLLVRRLIDPCRNRATAVTGSWARASRSATGLN